MYTTVFMSRRRLSSFSNMEGLPALHLGKPAGMRTSTLVPGILEAYHNVHTPPTPAGSETARWHPGVLTPARQRPGHRPSPTSGPSQQPNSAGPLPTPKSPPSPSSVLLSLPGQAPPYSPSCLHGPATVATGVNCLSSKPTLSTPAKPSRSTQSSHRDWRPLCSATLPQLVPTSGPLH